MTRNEAQKRGEPQAARSAARQLPTMIRAERLALLEMLRTLSPQEWTTPSLCGDWTVQEVAAHLAWAPVLRPWAAVPGLCRAGFRLNRFSADSAARWSRRGRDAILDQLADNAASGAGPVGMPQPAVLSDAVVHGLDVRRPLHRQRAIPLEAFVATADWLVGIRWPLTIPLGGSIRKRLTGLRLVADDLAWSYGQGPEVHATSEVMLLMLTGRDVEASELSGPGAARLRDRC